MIIYLCLKFQSNTPILSKVSHGNHLRYVRDGRTGRTYVRTAVILYAPSVNGGGIKMFIFVEYRAFGVLNRTIVKEND